MHIMREDISGCAQVYINCTCICKLYMCVYMYTYVRTHTRLTELLGTYVGFLLIPSISLLLYIMILIESLEVQR